MGKVTAQQRRLEAGRLKPLNVTARPADDAPGQFVQLAADPVGHAGSRRFIRMAVDDRQHFPAVFGAGQVLVIDLEVFSRRCGQVRARHILAALGRLHQHPASLGRVSPLGVCADLVLQFLIDAHDYLELAMRLAPMEPPNRRVLPLILQLLHQPPQRSSAGLSVGWFFLSNIAAPV